jgi:5-(carboxyamino)imidazole ribonucleotide mutase
LHAHIDEAIADGVRVFIGIAGLAAHLAGNVASKTTLPVIGVPGDGGPLNGFDALLSTVQMPKGVPVATVAIGKAGAINAGYLAAQMLSTGNEELAEKVKNLREEQKEALKKENEELQS